MSYELKLYNFSKRKNSSKVPSSADRTESCDLASDCTLANPRFKLASGSFDALTQYNYMKFENRFYYITDIESLRNGVVIITGHVDVLATYKSQFEKQSLYITRTNKENQIAYADNDNIIQPTNVKTSCKQNTIATGFSYSSGVISITTYGASGCDYNLVNSDLTTLTNSLFDDTTNLWDEFKERLNDPSKYVKSSLLLPHNFNLDYSVGTIIKLGNAPSVNISSAINITDSTRLKDKSYTLMVSTLKNNCTYYTANKPIDYRLYNPNFTKVEAFIPFVGKIAIPNEVFNFNSIKITYTVDVVTGQGECVVRACATNSDNSPFMVINKASINMGANIPLAYSIGNRTTVFKDFMTGNLLKMGVDMTINQRENISMIGSIDGVGYYGIDNIVFTVTEFESDSITDYENFKGRPCNKKLTLSGDIGLHPSNPYYVECLSPSVSINGLDGEREELNNLLESGIYYE